MNCVDVCPKNLNPTRAIGKIKELYVQKHLEEGEMKILNELLELEDNDPWDVVSGRSDRFEERFGGIVARLRAV